MVYSSKKGADVNLIEFKNLLKSFDIYNLDNLKVIDSKGHNIDSIAHVNGYIIIGNSKEIDKSKRLQAKLQKK